MANIQLFFSVQGTGGSPTGPDPENREVDQDNGSPDRPGPSVMQMSAELEHFVQFQDNFGEFPANVFLQNILHLHQQISVILRVDSLTLWKVINEQMPS